MFITCKIMVLSYSIQILVCKNLIAISKVYLLNLFVESNMMKVIYFLVNFLKDTVVRRDSCSFARHPSNPRLQNLLKISKNYYCPFVNKLGFV